MARDPETDAFDLLDRGNVTTYVKQRLFDGKIDTLDTHMERKKALAEPVRYCIVYVLYEYGKISRKRLTTVTGRTSNDLQHHLRSLLDANLISEIPAPEGADGRQTYYRITTLGRQEIASDIEHIVGGNAHEDRLEILKDPELGTGGPHDSEQSPFALADEMETESLQNRQAGLRSQWMGYQRATNQ